MPWVLTFVPVATVTPCEEPTFTVALPPTAVAPPPAPPTDTPALTPVLEALPPLPPVAAALPAVTDTCTPAEGVEAAAGTCTVALPPTAVARPPLPPVALPACTDAPTLTPVLEALPPLPPLAEALPAVADTCTPAEGLGELAGARAEELVCVAVALPPVAVALPPPPPVTAPLLTDTLAAAAGEDVAGACPDGGAAEELGDALAPALTEVEPTVTETPGAWVTPLTDTATGEVGALGDPAASAAPGNAKPAASTPNAPVSRDLLIGPDSSIRWQAIAH